MNMAENMHFRFLDHTDVARVSRAATYMLAFIGLIKNAGWWAMGDAVRRCLSGINPHFLASARPLRQIKRPIEEFRLPR